jgi:hypothetical protein
VSEGGSPITAIVAVYGAVVATANLIWMVYRHVSDRGRLKVDVMAAVVPGQRKTRLTFTVTNIGTKTCIVTHLSVRTAGKRHHLLLDHEELPHKLEPGEYRIFEFPTLVPSAIYTAKPQYFYAIDSLGNTYKTPRKQTRTVIDWMREETEETALKPDKAEPRS